MSGDGGAATNRRRCGLVGCGIVVVVVVEVVVSSLGFAVCSGVVWDLQIDDLSLFVLHFGCV